MALFSEKMKEQMGRVSQFIKDHPEEIRLAMNMQFEQMKEDFKKQFDALPREQQLKLMARLNELKKENSGK